MGVSRITDPIDVLPEYPAAPRRFPRRRQRDFVLRDVGYMRPGFPVVCTSHGLARRHFFSGRDDRDRRRIPGDVRVDSVRWRGDGVLRLCIA